MDKHRFGRFILGLSKTSKRDAVLSFLFAAATFGLIGTVTALWPNPVFVRMTPTAGFELSLLVIQSGLTGMYMGLRSKTCAVGAAGSGSVFGFLGVACPVCNKLLMFLFGSGLLLTYFEPIRLYVGVVGVVLLAVAVWRKVELRADFLLGDSAGNVVPKARGVS